MLVHGLPFEIANRDVVDHLAEWSDQDRNHRLDKRIEEVGLVLVPCELEDGSAYRINKNE